VMNAPPVLFNVRDRLKMENMHEIPGNSDSNVTNLHDPIWKRCSLPHKPLIRNESGEDEGESDEASNNRRTVPRLLDTAPLKRKQHAKCG